MSQKILWVFKFSGLNKALYLVKNVKSARTKKEILGFRHMQEKFEKIIFWKQPCICTFATYFLNEIMMSNFCRVFLNETF